MERIAPGNVQRVVAVDINPRYVEETGKRHARRLPRLELICADVQSEALHFDPPSPYRSLDVLEPMIRPVSPASLCSAAAAAGFSAADSCSILLDSGRRFRLQIFRRG